MNKRIRLKIACVDPRNWYSPNLISGLHKLRSSLESHIYLPNWSNIKTLSQKIYSFEESKSELNSSKIWGSYSYPLDIFKKALSDQVNLVHIQWEFNSFGSFQSSLLLPILLFLLTISKVKRVITIHTVIPIYAFSSDLPGLLPSKISRVPKIFVKSLFILLYKLVFLLSSAIIVHGDFQKKVLSRDYRLRSEKLFVIPYGIPSKIDGSYDSVGFNQTFLKDRDIILAWGTISPRKGLDILIEAFDKLSSKYEDIVLVIVGGVPDYYKNYYSDLKKIANNLIIKKRVIFLGRLEMQDVHKLLDMSKVVVFPYIYQFGASSTLTFALQHRKIVIISDLDFSTDFLTDGKNAILTKPKDSDSLAQAIEKVMCEDDLRDNIQQGINDLIRMNSWDSVARQTLRIYDLIL